MSTIKMQYLILGGTGYLGKKIIKALLERNIKVICIKRKDSNIDFFRGTSVIFWDIEELSEYTNKSSYKFECAINLACRYFRGYNADKDIDIMEANFINPSRFLDTLLKMNIERFISIDTALPSNVNIYAYSKKIFADYCEFVLEQHKSEILFINVLLENFYGEGEPNNRFLPMLIEKMKKNESISLTEGFQRRDIIYIDDVVNVIVDLTTCNIPRNKKRYDISVGTGQSPTIREVVYFLKKILDSTSILRFGAINMRANEPDTCADLTYLNNLGISVKYSWQEGLKKMLENKMIEEVNS